MGDTAWDAAEEHQWYTSDQLRQTIQRFQRGRGSDISKSGAR